MIELQDVRLTYDQHRVLDGIGFQANFFEKIAILGESGEGKTTILKLLLGLARPDSGRIVIDGQDITLLRETELRESRMKFSIVFQEGALFDSLDVKENVAYSMREFSTFSEDEIENRVRELLRRVGIEQAIHLMPDELSGGMQRRAAIARSLAACEPAMMLYDEPTSGLDPITADNICNLINELSAGTPPKRRGLIIVTHDVEAAVRVAERFLYLKDGKIVFDGSRDALTHTDDPGLRKFIRELLPR
jgi:phospholipid/cholesterol/gamma-HCH transport system ATP-binding protein